MDIFQAKVAQAKEESRHLKRSKFQQSLFLYVTSIFSFALAPSQCFISLGMQGANNVVVEALSHNPTGAVPNSAIFLFFQRHECRNL